MTHIWEHSPHSGSDLLMLLAIADHANDQGKAWPSMPTLAKKCRVTKRNAIYIIRRLEKAGSLSIERGGGRGHASVYVVNGAVDCTLSPQTVQPIAPFMERVQPIAPFNGETVQPASPLPSMHRPKTVKSSVIKGEAHCTPTIIEPIKKDKSKKPPSIISPPGEMDDSEGGVQVKSSKRKAETSKAQRRCPPDYLPDASVIAWAAAKHPGIDLQGELEAMKDWEFKVAHSDWNATFRNWVRTAAKRTGKDGDPRLSKRENFSMNAAQRFLDREEEYDTEHQESSIYRTPGRNERLLLR